VTQYLYTKSSVFWDIMSCNPHQSSACSLLHAGFFHGLFVDSECGGDIFLQNVSWNSSSLQMSESSADEILSCKLTVASSIMASHGCSPLKSSSWRCSACLTHESQTAFVMLSFHFTHKSFNFWKPECCVFISHLTFYMNPNQFCGVIVACIKGQT
jgi:hypothetical protein